MSTDTRKNLADVNEVTNLDDVKNLIIENNNQGIRKVSAKKFKNDIYTQINNDTNEKITERINENYNAIQNEILEIKEMFSEQIDSNTITTSTFGETILVTDSAKTKPKNIKIFGKTTQVTTAGNQLLNIPNGTQVSKGVTFTVENGVCTIKGTPTEDVLCWFLGGYNNSDTIFTLSPGDYYIKDCRIWSFDGTTRVNKTGALKLTEAFNVTGVYTETYTSGTAVNTTIYPMINKGLTALPFEPYTGNKPSPSIEYPQAVNSCGDDGNIAQSLLTSNLYNIYDKLQYNFEDCTIDSNDWCNVYYDNSNGDTVHYVNVQVKPSKYLKSNTEYLIVTETEYISGCDFYQVSGMEQASTQGQFKETFRVSASGMQINKITTRNNFDGCVTMLRSIVAVNPGNICRLKYRISVLADLSVTTNTFIYEKYTEQEFTVATPNKLSGIPVSDTSIANYIDETGQAWVSDYIDFERGKLVKMVASEYITDTPIFSETSDEPGRFIWVNVLENLYKNSGEYSLSNFAQFSPWGIRRTHTGDLFAFGGNSIYYNPHEQITVDEVNAKFAEMMSSGTPPVIIGQLAEPIITDLTPEEIAQYKTLYMNYPNTTIVNGSGAYMEVKYVADTKEYINQNYVPLSEFHSVLNRIAALEKI